jgi:hypothetical protein
MIPRHQYYIVRERRKPPEDMALLADDPVVQVAWWISYVIFCWAVARTLWYFEELIVRHSTAGFLYSLYGAGA